MWKRRRLDLPLVGRVVLAVTRSGRRPWMAPVVPLITCDEQGSYHVCEPTLRWIAAHTRPFGIVACAGKYRTGKSFLMNVLTNANPGFGVGHTVNRCTRGLWVCKEFFRVDEDSDRDVLFVDTEGIGAIDADEHTDVRIMTCTLLLSTCFVYNSVGAIDDTALSSLSFMSKCAVHLQQSANEQSTVASLAPPNFVWLMRDWDLHVETASGVAITADEYLETALHLPPPDVDGDGGGGGLTGKDATKQAIRSFFALRFAKQLPRPSMQCHAMDVRSGRGVSSQFLNVVKDLRLRLLSDMTPILSYGSDGGAVSGEAYAALVRSVVAAASGQNMPCMTDVWTALLHGKVAEASQAAEEEAEALLSRHREDADGTTQLPWEELQRSVVDSATSTFRSRLAPMKDGNAETKLRAKVESLLESHRLRRESELSQQARAAFARLDAACASTSVSSMEAVELLSSAAKVAAGLESMMTAQRGTGHEEEKRELGSQGTRAFVTRCVGWLSHIAARIRREGDDRETRFREELEAAHAQRVDVEALSKQLEDANARADALVEVCVSRATVASECQSRELQDGRYEHDDEACSYDAGDHGKLRPHEQEKGRIERTGDWQADAEDTAEVALADAVAALSSANARADEFKVALAAARCEATLLEDALVVCNVNSQFASASVVTEYRARLQAADDANTALLTRVSVSEEAARLRETEGAAMRVALEELRLRDESVRRDADESLRKCMYDWRRSDEQSHQERLRLQTACVRATEALEVRNAELRECKRQRDDGDELRRECKRLRAEAMVRCGELARADSEVTFAHRQTTEARNEGQMLRKSIQAMQLHLDTHTLLPVTTVPLS